MFRRRRLPEDLVGPFERFREVLALVERATSALTSSVPTTRLPGRPLAETLGEFEEELRAMAAAAPSWRAPEVEEAWIVCAEAVDECLARAERLRVEAPDLAGFESIIGTIDDLLAPLEAFREAAERFGELRRSARDVR